MEFNKNWTKDDNDKLRELIKNGSSVDYIREYFGNDKLFYHPNKKYYLSGKSGIIPTFKNFINEIKYEELNTDFIVDFEKSKYFDNEFNYNYKFQTYSGNRYIIDFVYIKDSIGYYKNRHIYNISFMDNSKEYEKLTFLKENHELVKRIIFIFKHFNKNYCNKCVYLIGESEDSRKTNWYRNLIKDTFDGIKEIEDISSFTNGRKAYYYEL